MYELTHQEILELFFALHYQAHEHDRMVDERLRKLRREGLNEDALANDEEVWEQVSLRDNLKTLAAKLLELSAPAKNNL